MSLDYNSYGNFSNERAPSDSIGPWQLRMLGFRVQDTSIGESNGKESGKGYGSWVQFGST